MRPLRADAQRSVEALVTAARALFASKGVDVTTREIADRAGVGMGTLYRRFPRRADLIAAVFEEEMMACAEAARRLAAELPPLEALAAWMQVLAQFLVTKQGLAKAVSSDDAVYVGLAPRFEQSIQPAIRNLYRAGVDAGEVRPGFEPAELLAAVSALCASRYKGHPSHVGRMVALLADGLRVRSKA